MKKISKLFFLFLSLCFTIGFSQQKHDFWDDIQNFKKLDAEKAPPKNAILLLGSSSFTKWKDVGNYFPEKAIINRAFGGSRLVDLNFYAEDILNPYQPKQVIIYCGENDIAHEEKPSSPIVFERFKAFFTTVRKHYPRANISYVSIKYSPSREQYWLEVKKVNTLIKHFIQKQKNANFIDITKAMKDADGNIRKDLFLEDMLHMKPEGYKIWAKVMKPYLK